MSYYEKHYKNVDEDDDGEEDELTKILEGRDYEDKDEEEDDELNRILEGRNYDDRDDHRHVGDKGKDRHGSSRANEKSSGTGKRKNETRAEQARKKIMAVKKKRFIESEKNDDEMKRLDYKNNEEDNEEDIEREIDLLFEEEDEEGFGGEDEAIEVKERAKKGSKEVIKVRRIVTNPLPKLNADRLTNKNGIAELQTLFDDVQLKGKGHEKSDLDRIMFKMQHWAHRLYPKMKFDDFLERMEVLGTKRPVKVFVKKIRYDLPLNLEVEDIVENKDSDDEMENKDKMNVRIDPEAAFDALFHDIVGENNGQDKKVQENIEPREHAKENYDMDDFENDDSMDNLELGDNFGDKKEKEEGKESDDVGAIEETGSGEDKIKDITLNCIEDGFRDAENNEKESKINDIDEGGEKDEDKDEEKDEEMLSEDDILRHLNESEDT